MLARCSPFRDDGCQGLKAQALKGEGPGCQYLCWYAAPPPSCDDGCQYLSDNGCQYLSLLVPPPSCDDGWGGWGAGAEGPASTVRWMFLKETGLCFLRTGVWAGYQGRRPCLHCKQAEHAEHRYGLMSSRPTSAFGDGLPLVSQHSHSKRP